MKRLQEVIIENLKHYREQSSLSQAKLAEKSNLSTNYISEIESGRSLPSIKSIEKISNILGVKPYQILMDIEDQDITSKEDLLIRIERDMTGSFATIMKEVLKKYR